METAKTTTLLCTLFKCGNSHSSVNVKANTVRKAIPAHCDTFLISLHYPLISIEQPQIQDVPTYASQTRTQP